MEGLLERALKLCLKLRKIVEEFEEIYAEYYVRKLEEFIKREKIPVAFIVYKPFSKTITVVSRAGGDEFEFDKKYYGDPYLLASKLSEKGIELVRCDVEYIPGYCEEEY